MRETKLDISKMYTVAAYAAMKGVSTSAVYKWIRETDKLIVHDKVGAYNDNYGVRLVSENPNHKG